MCFQIQNWFVPLVTKVFNLEQVSHNAYQFPKLEKKINPIFEARCVDSVSYQAERTLTAAPGPSQHQAQQG